MKTIGIYLIEGPNNCVYVGSSIQLEKRKLQHFWRLRNNIHQARHMQAAWNKYGKDVFTFTVVQVIKAEDFQGIESLIAIEQEWIDRLLAERGRRRLYNNCLIANSTLGVPCREETKRKIGQANAGSVRGPLTEEHRQKISRAHKGRKFGEDFRQKARENALRRPPASEESRRRMSLNSVRKISQEECEKRALTRSKGAIYTAVAPDGTRYEGIINVAAFAREHGLHHVGLLNTLKGLQSHTSGWTGFRQSPQEESL